MRGRSPFSEHVLCVRRDELFPDGAWHGFVTSDLERCRGVIRERSFFMPRAEVEEDPTYQQVIPFVLFRHGGRYLLMQRLRASSERRLRQQYTLGVGGHINVGDVGSDGVGEGGAGGGAEGAGDPVLDGMRREWEEEVAYSGSFEARLLGLLNDDTNPVSRVHLGVVFLVEGDSPAISIREVDKLSGELMTLEEMRAFYLQMESWSQIVYDELVGGRL